MSEAYHLLVVLSHIKFLSARSRWLMPRSRSFLHRVLVRSSMLGIDTTYCQLFAKAARTWSRSSRDIAQKVSNRNVIPCTRSIRIIHPKPPVTHIAVDCVNEWAAKNRGPGALSPPKFVMALRASISLWTKSGKSGRGLVAPC